MDWKLVEERIKSKLIVGLKIDSGSKYRTIIAGPDYPCINFNGAHGFRVRIGEKSFILIPFKMLKTVWTETLSNEGIYNRTIFNINYAKIASSKTGHPCYIHVVGKIFLNAEIFKQIDRNNYRII